MTAKKNTSALTNTQINTDFRKSKPPKKLRWSPSVYMPSSSPGFKDQSVLMEIIFPGGNSLTFGTRMLMSCNFLRRQIIRPTFSKTPNNQLSIKEGGKKLDTKKMAWIMTYQKYQTPNNFAYLKLHPVPKVKVFPPPTLPLPGIILCGTAKPLG